MVRRAGLGTPVRAVPAQRRFARYFAAISASVVSSMRLLKPHSLSYQLSTLTKLPSITRVRVAS